MNKKVSLTLEDGSKVEGISFGKFTSVSGEVVFNTGMVGYPEALTDPSYKGQILVLTYPLIGNYGVPKNVFEQGISTVFESDKVQVSGLVIANYSKQYFHFAAEKSLSKWLIEQNIPAMYAVDTRELTKKIREKGAMLGKMECGKKTRFIDPNKKNLVTQVSIGAPKEYGSGRKKVIVVDTGMKNNSIISLIKRGIKVKRVPWDYDFSNERCAGVLLGNGPGDARLLKPLIKNVRAYMKRNKPLFGICLGNQILSLAAGGTIYKMKYGHRSQNQPCIIEGTKRCYITTQNHGYSIKENTIPKDYDVWFRNANDNTVEGIKHKKKPFSTVQFHPEAYPGPVDTEWLFDEFVKKL
ncbi:glutamine-hydrolyzing carbamoyl-phosphate synthase small subunit [Patescibacteria group bacterium]|nr:glutamine-hydrolyzing carbamoyl-phosphate synthase small subunit [Patescibacteria group bacterium]